MGICGYSIHQLVDQRSNGPRGYRNAPGTRKLLLKSPADLPTTGIDVVWTMLVFRDYPRHGCPVKPHSQAFKLQAYP